MSLINDALKRASETKKQTGDPPPPVTLNPVDYGVRPNPAFRILVVVMLLTAVAFGIWFLAKWQEQSAQVARLHVPAPNAVTPATPPPPAAIAPVATRPRIVVSTNFVVREGAKAAAAAAAAAPDGTGKTTENSGHETLPTATEPSLARTNVVEPDAAVPAPEATNAFPRLKLQSIVYRLSRPAVVINGEMLYTGDLIKGARVVKIERLAVTLEWHGETNVLSLSRL